MWRMQGFPRAFSVEVIEVELLCPAGTPAALRAAVDHGADAVYLGFRDQTNARDFPGLNFTPKQAGEAVEYAHRRGVAVLVAVNTFAQAGWVEQWRRAIDQAADVGADAVILADTGLLAYAAERHPGLARHLSVQASITTPEAVNFFRDHYGIERAVLPRVLSMAQVEGLARETDVGLEVFGFGSLCVMAEGRCALSSYVTGESPNQAGVCSPSWAVQWIDDDRTREARLAGVLIDRFEEGERAGYPTLCKGRFRVGDDVYHAFESPTSLETVSLLPRLKAAGIQAVKIEGRQRSAQYVAQVTSMWRRALDALNDTASAADEETVRQTLRALSEGTVTTLGAYERQWQ